MDQRNWLQALNSAEPQSSFIFMLFNSSFVLGEDREGEEEREEEEVEAMESHLAETR